MFTGFEVTEAEIAGGDLSLKRPLNVLLIEDCPDTRLLVSTMLEGLGACCTQAFTSEAALLMLGAERNYGADYDLIIVDICLPGMDGITLARILRGRGYRGQIIAASARTALEDQEECRAAGCDAYINKLSGYADFLKQLKRCLHSCRKASERQDDEAEDEYSLVVNEFESGLVETFADLRNAHERGDWQLIEFLAHKLKTAALFGHPVISTIAEVLSDAASACNLPSAGAALDRLEKQIAFIQKRRNDMSPQVMM